VWRRKKRRANFDAPKVRTLLCECFVAKRSANILCPRPNAVNGQHCLFAFPLRKFDLLGAITACLTWIKCADLQKRYPAKLGGVLPWCCIPRLRRTAVSVGRRGLEELRSKSAKGRSRLCE
jgi:hypothetical protein